jgi:hypothetical protein
MTTGWPRNQQDLRWPDAEDDTRPGRAGRGEADSFDAGFGADHPSGPLPVSPASLPQQRGRLGRSKSRNPGRGPAPALDADADYDWIRYLGEAGPAQEAQKPPPADGVSRPQGPPPPERHNSSPPARDLQPRSALPRDLQPRDLQPRDLPPRDRPARVPRPGGHRRPAPQPDTWPGDRGPAPAESRLAEPWQADARPAGIRPADPGREQAGPGFRRPPAAAPRSWATQPDAVGNTGPLDSPWSGRPSAIAPDTTRTRSAYPDAERGTGRPAVTRAGFAPPAPARSRPLHASPPADQPAPGLSLTAPARPASAGHPGIAGLAAAGLAAAELDAPPERRRRGGSKRAEEGRASGKKARGNRTRRGADRSPADPSLADRSPADSGSAAMVSPAMAATVVQARPASLAPAGATGAPARSGRRRAVKKRRSAVKRSLAIGAGIAVVAAGAVSYDLLRPTGPVHTVTAPSRLLNYVQAPALANGMHADALRAEIVKQGHGEASNVVGGVYEARTGPAAKGGPVIILFVGGHLSGSASSFISSFTRLLPGAFVTSAGSMAGQAACVPSYSGHLAECVWADNDTFGFIASPALSAAALSTQLRQIRPLVEHTVK